MCFTPVIRAIVRKLVPRRRFDAERVQAERAAARDKAEKLVPGTPSEPSKPACLRPDPRRPPSRLNPPRIGRRSAGHSARPTPSAGKARTTSGRQTKAARRIRTSRAPFEAPGAARSARRDTEPFGTASAERLRRLHHLVEGGRDEPGLPSLIALRHEVRREDGQLRSAAEGDLRPMLVGERDP